MIRIRLNNCTIFWKQLEFLHGFDNLQNRVSVGAIRRFIFSFFVNQNFSQDRKAELLRKWIGLVLHGLPIKSKRPSLRKQIASSLSSQLIVLLFFTKQSIAERYLENIFLPVFLWTFWEFLQRIKKTFQEFLESSQKTPVAKSYFNKVADFYRNRQKCSVKKGVRKIHRKTPMSETLF